MKLTVMIDMPKSGKPKSDGEFLFLGNYLGTIATAVCSGRLSNEGSRAMDYDNVLISWKFEES